MTPAKLAKIRALAADTRGDPATRAIAQAALKRYAAEPPESVKVRPNPSDPRHPGMRTSPEYDRFRFMDIGAWKTTAKGNPTYLIVVKGRSFRIVMFQHKKRPTHGWMRVDTITDEVEFSRSFSTLQEAHEDAWNSLMAI